MAKRALSWKRAGAIGWRDLRSAPGKFGFVVLSVAVGVAALVGVRGFSAALPLKPCYVNTFRTPEVVEFAVSPQVGQAVLAFARSCLGSGLGSARAGRRPAARETATCMTRTTRKCSWVNNLWANLQPRVWQWQPRGTTMKYSESSGAPARTS